MHKNIPKSIIYVVLLFSNLTLSAQRPNQNGGQGQGQRQGQGQGQGERTAPTFDAENAVGIIKYKEKQVIKKMHLKSDDKKKEVNQLFSDYNKTIENIKTANAEKFAAIETNVSEGQKYAKANKDREAMHNVRKYANEKLTPIRREVSNTVKELNSNLEQMVSESEFRDWMKFHNSKKEAIKPKQPEGRGNGQRGGGQRNGQGRSSGS